MNSQSKKSLVVGCVDFRFSGDEKDDHQCQREQRDAVYNTERGEKRVVHQAYLSGSLSFVLRRRPPKDLPRLFSSLFFFVLSSVQLRPLNRAQVGHRDGSLQKPTGGSVGWSWLRTGRNPNPTWAVQLSTKGII